MFAMYSYGTFCSPNLNGFKHINWVLEENPRCLSICIYLETDPSVKVSETLKEYYELLSKR